jgi:hypothetical protein
MVLLKFLYIILLGSFLLLSIFYLLTQFNYHIKYKVHCILDGFYIFVHIGDMYKIMINWFNLLTTKM